MRKTIIYQMLPRLWGDGKLRNIDDKTLDHLVRLGVTHVWYTGIPRHSTGKDFVKGDPGSPYAICDYYDVNPYLAEHEDKRMEEFQELVGRTHGHGLKVITDFVPNHVGRDYSDATGGIPHHPYSDYDWTDTFKIDYSHPDTWRKLFDIVDFWAGKGVDGFRCDMVEMVPPEFFRWLISEIKKKHPGLLFIAEVYQKDRYRQYIKEVGFDLLYDKSGLYDVLRDIAGGHGSARAISWNWQFLQDLQPNMLNFLENHDEQRIASPWFTGSAHNAAYLAASLFLNTAPFMIYFGQEVGINASEGHEGRTSIFNWSSPEELGELYGYVHGEGRLSREKASILKEYRDAFALAGKDMIGAGLVYDLCYCQKAENGFDFDNDFVFIRKSIDKTSKLKHKTYLLYLNFRHNGTKNGTKNPYSSSRRNTVCIPDEACSWLGLNLDEEVRRNGLPLDVKDGGYALIELD